MSFPRTVLRRYKALSIIMVLNWMSNITRKASGTWSSDREEAISAAALCFWEDERNHHQYRFNKADRFWRCTESSVDMRLSTFTLGWIVQPRSPKLCISQSFTPWRHMWNWKCVYLVGYFYLIHTLLLRMDHRWWVTYQRHLSRYYFYKVWLFFFFFTALTSKYAQQNLISN